MTNLAKLVHFWLLSSDPFNDLSGHFKCEPLLQRCFLMDDFLIKLHTGDNNNDYEANPHQLLIRRAYHCVKGDLYEFYLSN